MLARLVGVFARSVEHPGRTLALAAIALACSLPGLGRLSVSADLSRLVPADSEASVGLGLVLEGFGGSDALYALVQTDDDLPPDPSRLRAVGARLAEALEGSEGIETARSRPADGLPDIDPLAAFDLLDERGYAQLRARLSADGVRARAEGLRNLLSSPLSIEARDLLVRDPLGLVELVGAHLRRSVRRMDAGNEDFLSPDGRALLLILQPRAAVDGDFPERLMAELHAIRRRVLEAGGDGGEVRIGFTGSYAHAYEIARSTRQDATVLSLASFAAILLLYLGFYRSLASLALVMLLLPFSAVLTLGLAGYLFGALNPLAVGFVAILFGLGIDPAIHLISRFRDARTRMAPKEAANEALSAVGPAVVVASTTTATALLSVAVADPRGHGQVGVLAGLAVAINAVVMLSLLPTLSVLCGRWISPDPGVGVQAAGWLARSLHRHSGKVLVSVAALLVALGLALQPLGYEATLSGFQPTSLEPVRVDHELRARYGEQITEVLVLLRGTDEESLLVANDRWAESLRGLEARGEIAGYESLAALRPSAATRNARRARAAASLPLAEAASTLRASLDELGFRVEVFEPAIARLESLGKGGAGALDRGAEAPLWMQWFEERHLYRVGDDLRLLTRVRPKEDAGTTALLLRDHAPKLPEGVELFVTGMALVEADAARQLRYRLPRFVAFALLVLFLVLAAYYRRPGLVFVAFVPLALSFFVYIGLYAATGQPFSPFALAGILLLIGVGIDDQVFLLDRYLEGGAGPRLERALAGAGRAILVTTLTSLAAFGTLSLSRFPALAQFGRSAALALALAFVGSVVLLPSLLARLRPDEVESGRPAEGGS